MDFKNGEIDHSRTIIHIDIDCFYAQVEMIKNPALVNKPLGIQQKNIVVTSNYIARQYGIKKCMLVSEAQKLCPNLNLVKGEDLHDYRQVSYNVTTLLQNYTLQVERLGLDENYLDVSSLVDLRKRENIASVEAIGHVFGNIEEVCQCGCYERLKIGTVIAQEIREAIKEKFKLSCCAGISHNKLLAKLIGAMHKPNQQTVVFPNSAFELLSTLNSVRDIPGIGRIAAETLEHLSVKTVKDLQNCDYDKLVSSFGEDRAKIMYNLSYGSDHSIVKSSGKPQSIGLEDSCKPITVLGKVKEKLNQLLKRLMVLLSEDKRFPRTIKLTVRKFEKNSKISHRETRQCNINPTLFTTKTTIELPEQSEHKLMTTIMNLFTKIVDVNRPYHVTLLGLSFTKFMERMNGRNSITSFLKKNVEVQSVTNIENKNDSHTPLMDDCSYSQYDVNADGSEPELEPSPKKSKLCALIAKRRCFSTDDCPSPSKLKVAELHLYSKEKDMPENQEDTSNTSSDRNQTINCPASNQDINCPPDADEEVFKELPRDLQHELWENYKQEVDRSHRFQNQLKKPKLNTILNYFVKN